MATANLEQYRISDLLEWHEKKTLKLNPDFQRRSVWTPAAKTYLIDTILRKLPIPKIYMRTTVDVLTKTSQREIVDGQQRLRAIIDFANNKYALGKRAKEFSGLRYDDLDEEDQETFLSYSLSVDQLINALDDDVLEIFARLNSYNIALNAPELRHAKYQGSFKWAVYDSAWEWEILWDKYTIVSVRERLRMLDVSLMAEMFGVFLNGVTDGGQPRITKMYEQFDRDFPQEDSILKNIDDNLNFITQDLGEVIFGPIASAPHFLMLFSAVAHCRHTIPRGEMGEELPSVPSDALTDIPQAIENLTTLGEIIDAGEGPGRFANFIKASGATTHRIASRKIRFPVFVSALRPERI